MKYIAAFLFLFLIMACGIIEFLFPINYPQRYVATMTKAKRPGKIYIDYLRNSRGATAIASYSTRARSGAPVATPLSWEELTDKLRPDQFTIRELPVRLAEIPHDPWTGFFQTRQSITKKMWNKLE